MVAVPMETGVPAQLAISDREFQQFRGLVYQQTGIALGESKRQLVCSRLGKRLRHYGYATFSQYYAHLVEEDPEGEELLRMINAITTNKTDFFREPHHFTFLRSEVLSVVTARAAAGGPRTLRIWSAGCSSGEEPYSIGFTVLDVLPRPWTWDVRILASDIDTEMLGKAKEGVYTDDRLTDVPQAFRERFFTRGRGSREGQVRVRSEVRDLLACRRINLREDAWPIRTAFDCIFCRNVIIYFDRTLQQRVVARLVELLKPGGHLFLGHSESLLGMRVGLRHVGNTVYQKAAGEPGTSRG